MGTLIIDAREGSAPFGPTRVVCGLPLVTRHLLAAAYDGGFTDALVVTSAATDAAVRKAVSSRVIPRIQLSFAQGLPPTSDAPVILAREVWTRKDLKRIGQGLTPEQPRLEVTDGATAEAARKRLLASIRKSAEADGLICYYLLRHVSRLISRLILPTPITPNMVTLFAFVPGVLAGVCAYAGGKWANSPLPLGLLWLAIAIDCIDGDIARLKFQFSRAGEWLDSMVDEFTQISFVALLGLGIVRDGGAPIFRAIGFAGAAAMILSSLVIYFTLAKRKLPIDSAEFPWFFGKPSGSGGAPKGIIGIVSWGFRRDFYITMIGLFCALHLTHWALVMMAAGAFILGAMMIVHQTVIRLRPTTERV